MYMHRVKMLSTLPQKSKFLGRRLFHCFFLLFINFMLATLSHSASDADKDAQICNTLLKNNRCLYEDMTRFWFGDRTLDAVLVYIIALDRADLMQQYLDLGGDPNRIGRNVGQGYPGYPLLVSAARHSSPGVLRVLLRAGANINAVVEPGTDHGRDGGKSALYACVGTNDYGSWECVRLLLKTGMNRNIRDEHRKTAVQYSFKNSTRYRTIAGRPSFENSWPVPFMVTGILSRWLGEIAAMGGDFERRRWVEVFRTLIFPQYSAHFNFYAMCQEFMRLHDENREEDFFPWMQDRVREVIAPRSIDDFYQNLQNPFVPPANILTGIALQLPPRDHVADSLALLLNDTGTDITVKDTDGNTIIHTASRSGNLSWLRALASFTRLTPEILAVTNSVGESVEECLREANSALVEAEEAESHAMQQAEEARIQALINLRQSVAAAEEQRRAAEEQRAAEERHATRNTILGRLLVSAVVTAAVGGITWWWLAHRRPASLGPRRIR
jgi:ankyrin repeat protein